MVEKVKVCGSVKVGWKNPKSVWWNDEEKLRLGERRMIESRLGT